MASVAVAAVVFTVVVATTPAFAPLLPLDVNVSVIVKVCVV